MCSQRSSHQVRFLISCIWNGTHLVFRRLRFASLPEVLVVHAKKFQLVNWVPAKLGPFIPFHPLLLLVAYIVRQTSPLTYLREMSSCSLRLTSEEGSRMVKPSFRTMRLVRVPKGTGRQFVINGFFSVFVFRLLFSTPIQRSCDGPPGRDGVPYNSLSEGIACNRK